MAVNFDKAGLIYGVLAFQLHILTMQLMPGDSLSGGVGNSKYEAMQAFLIIAYLVYLAAFILLILKHFGVLSDKIADICTIIFLFAAAVCTIIGIGIHGDIYGDGAASLSNRSYYQRAAYVTGALSGFVAGIFLVLPYCGVGSK